MTSFNQDIVDKTLAATKGLTDAPIRELTDAELTQVAGGDGGDAGVGGEDR